VNELTIPQKVLFFDLSPTILRCLKLLFPERILQEHYTQYHDWMFVGVNLLVRIPELQSFFETHPEYQIHSVLCNNHMQRVVVYIDGGFNKDTNIIPLELQTKIYFDDVCMGDFVLTKITDSVSDNPLPFLPKDSVPCLVFNLMGMLAHG
jgi:hypothetical protein